MGYQADEHGFLTITNKSITISSTEGWKSLSVRVASSSSASCTITSSSTKTIGQNTQNGITLAPGESTTIGSGQSDIGEVTIAAASGCTVYIQAVSTKNNI